MKKCIVVLLVSIALGFSSMASAGPITVGTSSAATLVNTIVGGGVTIVGTPTYIGAANQSATFTNGASSVGIGSGIVLTSGLATGISGPNTQTAETLGVGVVNDNLSTDLGGRATGR